MDEQDPMSDELRSALQATLNYATRGWPPARLEAAMQRIMETRPGDCVGQTGTVAARDAAMLVREFGRVRGAFSATGAEVIGRLEEWAVVESPAYWIGMNWLDFVAIWQPGSFVIPAAPRMTREEGWAARLAITLVSPYARPERDRPVLLLPAIPETGEGSRVQITDALDDLLSDAFERRAIPTMPAIREATFLGMGEDYGRALDDSLPPGTVPFQEVPRGVARYGCWSLLRFVTEKRNPWRAPVVGTAVRCIRLFTGRLVYTEVPPQTKGRLAGEELGIYQEIAELGEKTEIQVDAGRAPVLTLNELVRALRAAVEGHLGRAALHLLRARALLRWSSYVSGGTVRFLGLSGGQIVFAKVPPPMEGGTIVEGSGSDDDNDSDPDPGNDGS